MRKHKSHQVQQNLTSHAYVPDSLIYIMHHKFNFEYQKTRILIQHKLVELFTSKSLYWSSVSCFLATTRVRNPSRAMLSV